MAISKKSIRRQNNIVNCLPEDMLSEILTHVASNSVSDFANMKQSCKAFLGASNNDQIFENVPMDKLGFLLPWHRREKVLLKICKRARNAEALYRRGMINYFSGKKGQSGLSYLKNAADKGHVEAMYAYGIILICLGDHQLRKQGLQVLSSLNITSSRIVSCRLKTKKLLEKMWVRVGLVPPKQCCININATKPNRLSSKGNQGWAEEEEEASINLVDNVIPCCDSCFWDHEAVFFCSMLRKIPSSIVNN